MAPAPDGAPVPRGQAPCRGGPRGRRAVPAFVTCAGDAPARPCRQFLAADEPPCPAAVPSLRCFHRVWVKHRCASAASERGGARAFRASRSGRSGITHGSDGAHTRCKRQPRRLTSKPRRTCSASTQRCATCRTRRCPTPTSCPGRRSTGLARTSRVRLRQPLTAISTPPTTSTVCRITPSAIGFTASASASSVTDFTSRCAGPGAVALQGSARRGGPCAVRAVRVRAVPRRRAPDRHQTTGQENQNRMT